jgi:hypothetical protein
MSSKNQGAFPYFLNAVRLRHIPNYQERIDWLKVNGTLFNAGDTTLADRHSRINILLLLNQSAISPLLL